MTNPTALGISKLLLQTVDRSSPPVLLHDKVAQLAEATNQTIGLNDAFELVEPILDEIRAIMKRERNIAEQDGISWHVELYGSQEEWIRGSAYDDPSADPIERNIRARRALVDQVKSEILALKALEFERACTTVIEQMGCTEPHTSKARDDGGIDFYGRMSLQGRLDSPLPLGGIDSRVNVWLIGQAKHYPTRPIQTADIRELVGSVELARTGGAIHTWQGLNIQPFDAIIMLFFTTGWYSSGSKSLLAESGILAMNGEQLATFLCDVGLGFTGTPPDFDRAEFRNRLLQRA